MRQSRSEPFRPEAPTVPELAAGAVIFSAEDSRVLVIHESEEDRWCFPKGHVDPGESLRDAALREIREETGLAEVALLEELGDVAYRFYQPRHGRNVYKITVYYLGRTAERDVRLEPIFDRHEWIELADARARLPFESDRKMIEAAAARIPATGAR
jgi:8-oxo-dGTP pyrophosphatase MutT (NUDIX family)